MMQAEFVPECIQLVVLLKRKKAGVTVGEEVTEQQVIWPQVEDCGRIVGFGERVEEAIRAAVELAEAREADG